MLEKLPTSAFILIAANLIPLFGVIFLGWQVFDIMVIFWLENVIIGVLNVVKMLVLLVARRDFQTIFLIPFFILHYGIFTAVHGMFVFSFFGEGVIEPLPFDELNPLTMLLDVVQDKENIMYGGIALFISHLISLLINFLWAGEYKRTTSGNLMGAPYGRVMILHAVILLGGWAVMATGEKTIALALLVFIKIMIDLAAHKKSHKNKEPMTIE